MSNIIECQDCPEYEQCPTQNPNVCQMREHNLTWRWFNRQAMFRPDGTITSVPSKLTEQGHMTQLSLEL